VSKLITINSKEIYWKGSLVQHRDFAEIREYVDNCLKADSTSNFDLLLKLVIALDSTIPWPSAEQLSEALPQLPSPPKKKRKPRKPTEIPSSIDTRSYHERVLKHIAAIQGGLSGQEKQLKRLQRHKTICEIHIAKLEDWAKKNKQLHTMNEYNKQLPKLKKKVYLHQSLLVTYKSSIPQKKIIHRLIHDLENTLSNNLVYEELNWKLLPKGEQLTQSINDYLHAAKGRYPVKKLDSKRITEILTLNPLKAYIGNNEFDEYIVFIFNNSPYAVLECPWLGNAIYLLKKDKWPNLSKLPKSALLNNQSKHARRIIHDPEGNWLNTLKLALGK